MWRQIVQASGFLIAVRGIAAALILSVYLAPVRADDNETIERFLSRLGLVDLQAHHLEQTLDTLPPGESRRRLAGRLADLYSAQLMERSEDKNAYDRVLQRIQQLIERVPEARTASLEVMLLQADYFRAETLMTKWMSDRKEVMARDEASQILARITPQLDQRQTQLQADVDKLQAALDAATTVSDESEVQTRELNRLQAVAGRAAFFAAWSNYYLALSQPAAADSKKGFLRARDIFRRILGVDGQYAEVDASGLALESIWRARTLIGLGLAEAASGNIEDSKACFDLLDRSLAPPEIRELSSYWRVQSLLNAGRIDEALVFAKPVVESFTGSASQGKVSFCVSLVRAGFGEASPTPALRELGMLGVTGLIKLRQQGAVRQLLEKYQIPVDAESGFHLSWLQGQQKLEVAEKSKRQEDYAAAEEALRIALAKPDTAADLAGASQCRYQQAWCLYKLDKLETAARTYELALDGLKATDAKTAAEAAWMAFLCYQRLAKDDRKYAQTAVNVLRNLQRDFPEHPYAKRAEYYAGKLQQAALPPAETLANLARVPATSPDYLSSRFDICLILYEQWSKAEADKSGIQPKLLAAVDTFLAAAGSDADANRKLRVALVGADAALNNESPDLAAAGKYLETARRYVDDKTPSDLAAEYHYRSLQRSITQKDDAARRRHADWIVRHGAGSAFEVPALIVVAKGIDDVLEKAASPTRDRLEEARKVYERLAAHFGDEPAVLQSTKNAQVAVSRLAHYSAQLGEHADAARLLGKLLEAFPNDRAYLRRAGLSTFEAKNYSESVEYWRKLVAGLPKGDAWHEAKYYQLASLSHLDRMKAREALAQYLLLFPQLGPPAWRGKFAELQQQVE